MPATHSDSPANSDRPSGTIVRADLIHRFFLKFLAVGLLCAGMSAYFFYDGAIGYPAQAKIAREYYDNPTFKEDAKAWIQYAAEKGYSENIPTEPEEIEAKIPFQYIFGVLTAIVAVFFLLKYLLARGSYIQGTPQQLSPSWTKPIDLSTVTKLDKRKWKDKGIARVHYGKGQVFILDDFKFERQPMAQFLRWIETRLTDQQIINGSREADATESVSESAPDAAAPAKA